MVAILELALGKKPFFLFLSKKKNFETFNAEVFYLKTLL